VAYLAFTSTGRQDPLLWEDLTSIQKGIEYIVLASKFYAFRQLPYLNRYTFRAGKEGFTGGIS